MNEQRHGVHDPSQEVNQPNWLIKIRKAYQVVRQAGERAKDELGDSFGKIGQIDREESARAREAFHEFLGQAGNRLPETILLSKRNGWARYEDYGRMFGGKSFPTIETSIGYKSFYLPRTDEILTYFHERSTAREELDPESSQFIGVGGLRGINNSAVSISPRPLLSDESMDKVLKVAEEALKFEEDRSHLQDTRERIAQVNAERTERKLQAERRHGEGLARSVGNLADSVIEHFGIALPKRLTVKEDTEHVKGSGYVLKRVYSYYPREKRLTMAPAIKKTGFLGRGKLQADRQSEKDVGLNEWAYISGYVTDALLDLLSREQWSFVKS